MDDIEDDARYPPKTYTLNYYNNPSSRRKVHMRENPYPRPITNRYEEEEDDGELDEFDEENEGQEDQDQQNGYIRNLEEDDGGDDFERHPKKRKLKNLVSRYEFAPRVKPSHGDRNLGNEKDWTDHSVFVLLEVWGDRFLQLGRKSLRSEDWREVAEKVTDELKIERTETQCRNMLDTLKRRYKKEKMKMEEMGLNYSKWAYYKKMHMLMASPPRQDYGLACGVDSGEYVFMNTRVYLDRSNRYDEMRDSPGESETSEGENENGNDLDGIPSRRMTSGGNGYEGSSVRVLADSIQKFGEVYEKIESSKRQQMMELEKMRLDFHKELELQKKQILERAQVEIAKIQEEDDDDEETDPSAAEDLSE